MGCPKWSQLWLWCSWWFFCSGYRIRRSGILSRRRLWSPTILSQNWQKKKFQRNRHRNNKRQFTKELYQDVFDSQAKIFLILLITMMTDPTSTTDSRQTTLVRFIVENIYYALCFSLSDILCCRILDLLHLGPR